MALTNRMAIEIATKALNEGRVLSLKAVNGDPMTAGRHSSSSSWFAMYRYGRCRWAEPSGKEVLVAHANRGAAAKAARIALGMEV